MPVADDGTRLAVGTRQRIADTSSYRPAQAGAPRRRQRWIPRPDRRQSADVRRDDTPLALFALAVFIAARILAHLGLPLEPPGPVPPRQPSWLPAAAS